MLVDLGWAELLLPVVRWVCVLFDEASAEGGVYTWFANPATLAPRAPRPLFAGSLTASRLFLPAGKRSGRKSGERSGKCYCSSITHLNITNKHLRCNGRMNVSLVNISVLIYHLKLSSQITISNYQNISQISYHLKIIISYLNKWDSLIISKYHFNLPSQITISALSSQITKISFKLVIISKLSSLIYTSGTLFFISN